MFPFIITFVNLLFNILIWAIIIRALLSWFRLGPDNPIVRILDDVTEPVLAPLRRVVPMIGFIDITPIVAIILLNVIQGLLLSALRGAY